MIEEALSMTHQECPSSSERVVPRISTHGKLTYRAGCRSAIKPGPVGLHPNACFVFVLDAWKSALTK
jgi:hypothetical protein